MNITGRIVKIFPEERKTDKFSLRIFVIDTGARYGNLVPFQLVNDKCDLVDRVSIGQEVNVSFDIVGTEYKEKHYVNLNAYRIDSTANSSQPTRQSEAQAEPEEKFGDDANLDDLPF